MQKLLSIIISNRNDTAMLSVTVNSCIEELRPLGLERCEIVICDNSDGEIYNVIENFLPSGYIRDGLIRVIRQDFPCLFTARETAIEQSSGEFVSCLDSHMIVGSNMFVDLVNFMISESDNSKLGFAHAPLRWAHHHERNSVHDRDMSVNELGDWGKRADKECKITWKGMPWICRREWFLNRDSGLNGYGALRDHRISWGGGDMHIGIKPWLLGFENWAVPTFPAIHIGPFPKVNGNKNNPAKCDVTATGGYKYRLYGASGNYPHAFGFLVSCYVLGGEDMMDRNKKILINRFGKYVDVNKWWDKAKELGQREKDWLDSRKKFTFQELLNRRPWDDKS
jgi:glycosyltransferase involved in cell wall biosynthesis